MSLFSFIYQSKFIWNLPLHFYRYTFDNHGFIFLYRSAIARLVSRLLKHLPRFAVYQIRIRRHYLLQDVNLINLCFRLNFLKAKQKSNITHHCFLTNAKRSVKNTKIPGKISWGCNDNSVYIREFHPTTN